MNERIIAQFKSLLRQFPIALHTIKVYSIGDVSYLEVYGIDNQLIHVVTLVA